MGAWVSKALYFWHKRLDKFCFADVHDLMVESFEGIQSPGDGPECTLRPSSVGVGSQILRAPNDQLAPSTNQTVALEATVDELSHLLITINQQILSFSICGPLAFSNPPTSQSLEYATHQAIDYLDAHTPELNSSSSLNNTIWAHETNMSQAYQTLHEMDLPTPLIQQCDHLHACTHEELRRIEEIKIMEWNRQVQLLRNGNVRHSTGAVNVDSGVYFRWSQEHAHPAAVAAMILVLALSLMCGISQKQAAFALVVLKFIDESGRLAKRL
ncbi:hypothetical protein EDD17DRAFT_1515401 [Pisolithus thermaeus]|nr:hypothetical protein EDD17DRAFT_1515401 [Pisolithus thermaeus]